MPAVVRPVTDERDALLAFLAQQRAAICVTAFGLTDEEASRRPSASELSLAGLIKHTCKGEHRWVEAIHAPADAARFASYDDDEFVLADGETLADVFERYAAVAAETERIVGAVADLGDPVPVPPGIPWFPDDVEAWSVRWVLLHVIEETARHAGHADIVRESLDGSSFFALVAAAEA
jgi:hypothetical protein